MCKCITAHARPYIYHLVRASPRHLGKEHTVSDKRERGGSEKRQKTLLRAVRFSPDEDEIIRKKAEDARLTVSAYIRSAALNKRVHS
ncbi:plasmid mobilization protein [Salmonella enterica]|uniref:plasmid mobilization protein n=1 Tax=Salmonella enterica TaxID=28901 RepID=UPI0039A487B6